MAYDDEGRDAVRAGANLLVVQSNNATYMRDGQTRETLQQLAMARLRAREYDRAVIVATPTGISAIVRPDGSLEQRTAIWTADTLLGQVELRTTRTMASRLGAWPEGASVGVAAIALAHVLAGARRTRRQGRPNR